MYFIYPNDVFRAFSTVFYKLLECPKIKYLSGVSGFSIVLLFSIIFYYFLHVVDKW